MTDSIEEFLAYSVKLEEEAVLRFGQLADAMHSAGNTEVSKLFRQLANYSRLHLGEARARAGFRTLPALAPGDYFWPDLESPESAAIWAADPLLGREQALEVALNAERAGLAYYSNVFTESKDHEVREMAREFVKEEAAHVAELQRWLQLHQEGKPLPIDIRIP